MSGLNTFDFILLGIIFAFALLAMSRGFVQVLASLVGFVITLFAALSFHTPLAQLLEQTFKLPATWGQPIAFIAIWVIGQFVFSLILRLLLASILNKASHSQVDRVLALLPGAVHGLLVTSLFVTFVSLLPLPGIPRDDIDASFLGSRMIQATMAFEQPLEAVFGPALKETVGFLTVRPEASSEEAVSLNFTVVNPTLDTGAEESMLELVNTERTQRGLSPLAVDDSLRRIARAYATEMFQQGYFSHVGRDGRDPFARMRDAGITYGAAGENLALSPSTEVAHEGLMNSPGHRANILNPQFRKVGIGVVDGGIHGKMFVQEFTD